MQIHVDADLGPEDDVNDVAHRHLLGQLHGVTAAKVLVVVDCPDSLTLVERRVEGDPGRGLPRVGRGDHDVVHHLGQAEREPLEQGEPVFIVRDGIVAVEVALLVVGAGDTDGFQLVLLVGDLVCGADGEGKKGGVPGVAHAQDCFRVTGEVPDGGVRSGGDFFLFAH